MSTADMSVYRETKIKSETTMDSPHFLYSIGNQLPNWSILNNPPRANQISEKISPTESGVWSPRK